jgi:hypothetical protein
MAHLDGDHLPETLARLDELIDRTENEERRRSGLGMRLALTMAHELREKRDLGELSGALVASWVERFGQDAVDAAVAIAREFLTQPDRLVKEFASRIQSSPPPHQPAAQNETPPLSSGEAELERGRG